MMVLENPTGLSVLPHASRQCFILARKARIDVGTTVFVAGRQHQRFPGNTKTFYEHHNLFIPPLGEWNPRTKQGNIYMGVFTETLKEYGLGSGDKFKVQEGKDVIRILSEPRMVQSVYQGQPNTKFVAWVIDRADSKIKLYYMPKTILEAISAYEDDEQFGFSKLPMPYDITINARGAGTKDVVYNVLPGKAGVLTPGEQEEFRAKKPIDEVVAKLLESQNVSEVQQGGPSDVQMTYSKGDSDVPPPTEPPPPSRFDSVPPEFRPRT